MERPSMRHWPWARLTPQQAPMAANVQAQMAVDYALMMPQHDSDLGVFLILSNASTLNLR